VGPAPPLRQLPEEIASALRAFHGRLRAEPDERIRKVVELMIAANLLDEHMESVSLDPGAPVWERLFEVRQTFEFDVIQAAHEALASRFHRPGAQGWNLPVQAAVAQEVVATLTNSKEVELPVLTALAERDPVLAGMIIRAANSALYARHTPAKSVQQAASFLGGEATRTLLLTLAVKAIFVSARLLELWRHSVLMASICEALAHDTGFLAPEEALLLGLVHDVGTVAMQQQPREAASRFTRLAEKGFPQIYIERMQFGLDHADAGAEVLESWRFPTPMIEAVRYHHRPAETDSRNAAVLYMAEFWLESENGLGEDLPSLRQWREASERTGWSTETLMRAGRRKSTMA
jgi:putative nucleotidyltransferase with HDIG domain